MRNFWRHLTLSRPAARKGPAIALLLISALTAGLFLTSASAGQGMPAASAAENVVLTVDAGKEVYPFKDTMRGVATNNWNWLWEGLGEGLGDGKKGASGKAGAIIDATSYVEPGIIRFAGGLWANRVGWSRDGSAPDDGAWTFRDSQSGKSYGYTHAYKPAMVDAFQEFRTKLGAQAIIQVNVCDNNIKMWQDLLRYTNTEKKYGFEYWEIGNEQTLDSCGLDPESYAQRYREYQTALKAVDPSIKVLGPIAHQPYYSNWEEALVDEMGADLDVLAWHWYQLSEWTSNAGSYAYQGGSLEALMSWGGSVGACQDGFGCPGKPDSIADGNLGRWTYRRGIAEQKMDYIEDNYRKSDPTLETAITEFGVHASAHTHPVNGNHTAAVWLADVLGRWAYNGLDIVTYYSLEDGSPGGGNSRGLLGIGSETRLDVRPTYYTEFMYARYFGDMMVQSSTSDPEQKVVVWASKDTDDPGKLKLMLVNLSGDEANAQVNLKGFDPASGEAYVMESGDPLSMEDPEAYTEHSSTINGVKIPDYDISNPSAFRKAVNSIKPVDVPVSGDFEYSIPAYSVVALTLNGKPAPVEAPPVMPPPGADAGADSALPAPANPMAAPAQDTMPAPGAVVPAPEPGAMPSPEAFPPDPAPAAVPETTEAPAEPPEAPVRQQPMSAQPQPVPAVPGQQQPPGADAMLMLVSRTVDRRPGAPPASQAKDATA
jgi:alpha-L-arabinofuranosidase